MKYTIVNMPAISSNEERAELIEWRIKQESKVEKNQIIAIAETTKTTFEIIANDSGILHQIVNQGDVVTTNEKIEIIFKNEKYDFNEALKKINIIENKIEKQWTKKAELIAKKLGVEIEELAKKIGRTVTEADVLANNTIESDLRDLTDNKYPAGRRERILLIGGGGGGGALAVDAIQRTTHQRAVGILDNNVSLHGKTMLGVPVIGNNSRVMELYKEDFFDAAIIVVTADINERKMLFIDLKNKNIKFTNIIDPSVIIRTNVSMGSGNLILANGFIAACVSMGDNNFLASHTCIEHHSVVGSHCTFGPRTTTSGAVVIGDKVKFGMGVMIEPYITIGSNSLIPSGAVVTTTIPEDSVIKILNSYKIVSNKK